MMNQKNRPSKQLAEAIENCGVSRYAIWKATGIEQSTLSRIVNGKGWIGREDFDTLCEFLDLHMEKKER